MKTVQSSILRCLFDGKIRGIDTGDFLRPGEGGIESERAGVGKAVQDTGTGAEFCDCMTIFLLIEEKAGLLAVFDIHDIADAVFRDGNKRIERITYKAFGAGQTFLLTDLCVAALINAAHPDPVFRQDLCQRGKNDRFETVDSQRQGFHDQNILVLVDRDTGEKIRLAEDDPAGGGIDYLFAILPCRTHSGLQKGGSDLLFFFSAQHTDTDL